MNITQCLFFPEQFEKPVVVKFDEPCSSSDGGALLLKGADQKLDLSGKLSAILIDRREAGKVRLTFTELIQQRVYGLASGYADANDAARIGRRPGIQNAFGSVAGERRVDFIAVDAIAVRELGRSARVVPDGGKTGGNSA